DASFPGFFLMSNRVVPSVTLPDWADGNASRFFQHQVVAVDGVPVNDAAAVYRLVREAPVDTPFTYTFMAADGSLFTATVRSERFSWLDYSLVFGAYLLNGVFFIGTGLLVAYLKPRSQAGLALLSSGLAAGVFATTAADLYGPCWFTHLHTLAES